MKKDMTETELETYYRNLSGNEMNRELVFQILPTYIGKKLAPSESYLLRCITQQIAEEQGVNLKRDFAWNLASVIKQLQDSFAEETQSDEFRYVLASEKIAIQIANYIKEKYATINKNGIDSPWRMVQIGYGVTDLNNEIFATYLRGLSDCIKRCDDGWNDEEYIILHGENTYYVELQCLGRDTRNVCTNAPKDMRDRVVEAALFCCHNSSASLGKELEKYNLNMYHYNQLLKDKYLSEDEV